MTYYGVPPGQQGRWSEASARGPVGRRTVIVLGIVGAIVIGAGTAYAAGAFTPSGDSSPGSGRGVTAPSPAPSAAPSTAASTSAPPSAAAKAAGAPAPGAAGPISLSATGDIIMGKAPGGLPPDGAKGFFDPVKGALGADLVMGNLEQALTDATGSEKCAAASTTCFAFRTPPAYAQVLRDAGFGLVNLANNHAYDFGSQGFKNTQTALDGAGIRSTGSPGQITVVDVKGVKVAVLGFAPYGSRANDLTNLSAAAALVKKAAGLADVVVVQAHMGAEGEGQTHVKPGIETYLGENRGDPIKFAHTVIDAGADLVIGHGPHVMRGMEFYHGHLIAYSLGNFAGYKALQRGGALTVSGVLHVTLNADGTFAAGSLTPTTVAAPGLPRPDPLQASIALVGALSKADFPATAAKLAKDGTITP